MNSLIFQNTCTFFHIFLTISKFSFSKFSMLIVRSITRELFDSDVEFFYEIISKISKFWSQFKKLKMSESSQKFKWIEKNQRIHLKILKTWLFSEFRFFANLLKTFRHYYYAKSLFLACLIWSVLSYFFNITKYWKCDRIKILVGNALAMH